MKPMNAARRGVMRLLAAAAAVSMMLAAAPPAAGQSESGFTYNGIDLVSYQPSEYLDSSEAAQTIKATNANYAAVVVTQYVQNGNATTIAPETTSTPGYNASDPLTPTDDAVVAAIQNLQAQGITVMLKPLVNSIDGTWNGDFTWPSSDTTTAEQQAWLTAWFSSYETFILHYAQIAAENNVSVLVIGTELRELSGSNCAGASCESYWLQYVINPIRAQYPNLTLAYGANATGPGDEFTTVTFWNDVDIIGVDGYFDLTDQADPSVSQLVSAWTNSPANGGFNAVQALENLASAYSKPLIFTEIGYESTPGTNEEPWNYSLSDGYDPTEQADCYEAFFQVFSQQTAWMKGVFWWEWNVSPPAADDIGYSPQNKTAGDTELPTWFGAAAPGFTLAPSSSSVSVAQGQSASDTISITALGGFNGSVTLSATNLPSGVTPIFTAGTGAQTQILTLTASNAAALQGPVTVTITGTSGALTASTTIAVTVITPVAQSITFANPGQQLESTQLALTATASSGLPVTYASSTTGVCTVNNATATASLLTPGTCTITASQAGNGIYTPATPVTQSFLVVALTPTPIPVNAQVVVSQLNWLAALGGSAFVSANADGSSFGVNSNGAVAIADTNSLVLYNSTTGAATTLGAWPNASAVAIDSQNNLYVGNLYGSSTNIVKLPYTGGTSNGGYAAFTTPAESLPACSASSTAECALPSTLGLVNPGAMTFDASGNLFWVTASDGSSGGNGIWECNAACLTGSGAPVQLFEEPTASPAPSSSSGQMLAGSIAIDSAGNLFFTDSSIYVDPSTSAITSFYSNLKELPVSAGTGYGGVATGYSASPVVLYTLTPASAGPYDAELDAVAVRRNSASGDTVYFADESDGVFAFPDTAGGIPLAGGQPTALYMVSTQGAKTLAVDTQGNLYLAAYSNLINSSGADTLAQITLGSVTAPASPAGTAVSPSPTLNAVTTLLNDTSCTGSPAPQVNFTAGTSASATAAMATTGSCAPTFTGGSAFATTLSFTPLVAGADSITLTGTDQAAHSAMVTVSGTGTGFTLSPTAPSVTLAQGSTSTDTLTITGEGGFTGAVTLAASGLPSGVTASFATNPATSSSVVTLTATNTATAGGPVTVTITGTSGTFTASTTIALTVNAVASFSLAASAPSVSVTQGASNNTESIAITPLNGFNSSVTLTASGLPSGVTASFSPNPTTSSASVLTLTASNSAATGQATVTITGTSGTLTETATLTLTVNAAPSFSLSAAASAVTMSQGESGIDTITVTPANGFTGSVSFTASGLPNGATANFSPNPSNTGSSILTLTAGNSASTGQAAVTITGTSGTLTETTTLTLTVNQSPSFTLFPWPTGITLAQGTSASNSITITGAGGFSGSVTFTASGLPNGVTASFAPNPTLNSTVMTLTASSTAALGEPAIVTITGTSGALTATTAVAVTVTAPPSFTLSSSPGSVTASLGGSVSSTIMVNGANQFAGQVTLSASGLPSGVTASFTPNPAATYSVLTLTAGNGATAEGPVTVTVNGVSGTLTASTSVALTVSSPPGFTLSSSPAAVSLAQGGSQTSTITVTDQGGFGNAVTLSATGLPNGVTASFAAGTNPGTQVLTLTAASNAAIGGPVMVTILGASGTFSAATTLALTVTSPAAFSFSGSSLTVTPGSTSGNTASISVAPVNGFTGTIYLTCTVAPALASDPATCSLSPDSVTISGPQAQTVTMTVNTTGTTSAENRMKRLLWPATGGTALALLLFFRVPRRRKNWLALLALLVLFISMGGMGCTSTASTNSQTNTGTPPGAYVITIIGTSGSTIATGQINLTVQ